MGLLSHDEIAENGNRLRKGSCNARDNSDRYYIIYGKDFVGDSYGVKGLLPVVDEKKTFCKGKTKTVP